MDKETFFKDVKNTADLFPKEEEKDLNKNIEELLDEFFSAIPAKHANEFYRAGKLQGKTINPKTGDEELEYIHKIYIECIKKIYRDNNIPLTEKDKQFLDLLSVTNGVILATLSGSLTNAQPKIKISKEQIIAYFLGNLTTRYNKTKEDYA